MPGARCARSLACKIKKHTSIVTTVTPKTPGIPRAMVLTVSFVISPVIGLVCHRRFALAAKLDASTAASGPHDFAVRDRPRSSVVAPASTASHRNVRDDRDPPLICRETRGVEAVICPTGRAEYFCAKGWTDFW